MSRIYRFSEFEFDLNEETLRRDGEKLDINNRMFQVLRLLVERPGEVVTKSEFFDKVWGGSFVEDNNLTVTITGIRKALGDNAKQARFIENLPRKGYRFIAPVDGVDFTVSMSPILPEEVQAIPATPALSGYRTVRSFKIPIAILSVLVVLGLVIGVVGRKIIWPAIVPASDRIDSIAVLPFEDHTAGSEYLADGLTDSIISNLSRRSGLRVIDRNAVYFYKDKATDRVTAGRELNVRAVVTGQIEKSGDVIIINAELTDLDTKTQLWHQQFRRRGSDIYATQLEISQAIIRSLRSEISNQPPGNNEKGQSRDPIAFDLYLKGRYYWNKRTDSDFIKSVELFKSAIDQDPTFAQAYIGLADAYTLGDFSHINLSPEEKNSIIRANIQRALEIDDSLGEAYAALAINKCYYDWDFSGAESDYRRAIELNPNNATAHHWYAEFLAMQGRFQESFAEYDRAISLDPLSLPIKTDRAFNYYYTRDFDGAIELLNKVKESNPDYARTYEFLSVVYREKGSFGESVESLERLYTLQFQIRQIPLQEFERRKAYITKLKSGIIENGADGYWRVALDFKISPAPYYSAAAYSKLGNADKAFEFLDKSIDVRDSNLVWLKVTPDFAEIRSDPRYQDMLRRVGFSD